MGGSEVNKFYINFVHEDPQKLSNDLRIKILENYVMKRKSQNWVETQASVQSHF